MILNTYDMVMTTENCGHFIGFGWMDLELN
jgi:hypothetical protein